MADFAIEFADVERAARRIHDHIIRTPVLSLPELNELAGTELFFKCENFQHVGAFKARGACNAVFSLSDEAAQAGVITHSSGNHAAALARAARLRSIDAHIVMPENSAAVKLAAVRRLGVEPVFSKSDTESREAVARRVQEETGATFIHPFDNDRVMAGQGTTALELLTDATELDALVVPVGGGGLLSGSLIVAQQLAPRIPVYAAEPAWADDSYRSLQSGKIEIPERYDTIADGLRTPLGQLTFPIVSNLLEQVLLVSEDQIRLATRSLIQQGRMIVEPSGAVSLAAVLAHPELFAGKRVGLIISGGNIDSATLHRITSSS